MASALTHTRNGVTLVASAAAVALVLTLALRPNASLHAPDDRQVEHDAAAEAIIDQAFDRGLTPIQLADSLDMPLDDLQTVLEAGERSGTGARRLLASLIEVRRAHAALPD